MAGAQVGAEPGDDERDGRRRWGAWPAAGRGRRSSRCRHRPPWRVCTFSATLAAAPTLRVTGSWRVGELAGAGDQRDGADARGERIDGAGTSKESCGRRLPKSRERQVLEDDVGGAAVGRRVAGAFAGLDEAVGGLRLAAGVARGG